MLSQQVQSRLQELHPDIATRLDTIIGLAPESTDPQLLALCSSYVDAALRNEDWTPPSAGLSDKEQAFIQFTEQFTASVSTMSDQQVASLQNFASADEIYAFVNALYVADMTRRLDLVAGRMMT